MQGIEMRKCIDFALKYMVGPIAALFLVVLGPLFFRQVSCLFVNETYQAANTSIRMRIENAWSGEPRLVISDASGTRVHVCMIGCEKSRIQVYSAGDGVHIMEGRGDTLLVKSDPISVEGPSSWMKYSASMKDCSCDGTANPPDEERSALRAGLKASYVGAFDNKEYSGGRRGCWQFWPTDKSPEQVLSK
jgi:hypothetical protein